MKTERTDAVTTGLQGPRMAVPQELPRQGSLPLRIVIVTQDDPFYVPRFFEEFSSCLDPLVARVECVVIQEPLGKRKLRSLFRQMWSFYGPAGFLRMGVAFTLRKAGNVLALRLPAGVIRGSFSVEHVLRRCGWPVLRRANVNDSQFHALLRDRRVDLVVSVAASQKFKPALLGIPPYGCINVHTSRLPRNRGMMPNFWSLMSHDIEPRSAVTIHKMNETIDDGPIILQDEFDLDPGEPLHRLMIRTKRLSARSLVRALRLYENGEPPLLPNDATHATYNTFPNADDVRRFRRKGLKLL